MNQTPFFSDGIYRQTHLPAMTTDERPEVDPHSFTDEPLYAVFERSSKLCRVSYYSLKFGHSCSQTDAECIPAA